MDGLGKGIVYLVGAGPGDAKLITLKGLECIQRSDVIVYDRLASPRLLKYMKAGAEKVYVGKLPDRHTMKQEDINQLLVDLALEGKVVTRLKGGDPTVFGRVGEEAELLRTYDIEYEIVPGITSAIAVPAYAGIPVTHRDLASSFSVITGHESPDKLDKSIYWDKVTNATGTLVFLMGVAKIDYISEQLINHGRPPETPVALVRWGTRPEQETLVGTLATIAEQVRTTNFQSPAVIIVGDVVLQREKLKWVERLPLFGRRVLVTRARSQASDLVQQIEDLGGEPLEFPVIETRRTTKPDQLAVVREVMHQLESYDWAIFTSVNGVECFFEHLRENRMDIRRMTRARVVAVGPKTAEALEQHGIMPESLPEQYRAEGILDAIQSELKAGQRVLLPRGDLARAWLPDQLQQLGLDATDLKVYETVQVHDDEEEQQLIERLEAHEIHVITFTSSSTVTNFIEALHRQGVKQPWTLLDGIDIACIGPLTAETAIKNGLTVSVVSQEATIESLVDSLRSLAATPIH
ncbi:uroporphyrinogen-III C-methyltransferase [Paenibacillus selenitireducens]|uniref:Uroporphyrinogen-III C-methyltransferase n=1 Tax=Paenibacillus selenitireducens TaxID=1324314 RepID=A0A1T2XKD8_9BACL|nr:uroporphyrinogen-III C-methyltransferase [Paenibacillus selenitireducens]